MSFWPRRPASAAVRRTAIAGFPLDASGCVLKFPGLLDQVFELLPLCVIRHVGAYLGRNHVSVKKGAFCQGHDMGGQGDGAALRTSARIFSGTNLGGRDAVGFCGCRPVVAARGQWVWWSKFLLSGLVRGAKAVWIGGRDQGLTVLSCCRTGDLKENSKRVRSPQAGVKNRTDGYEGEFP